MALLSTLGSLFFSEVMKLPPCSLCWYQRISLYPLVLVMPVGIVLRDRNLVAYALPLVLAGLGFALYHNLLYYGVIPEDAVPLHRGRALQRPPDRLARLHHHSADGAGGLRLLLSLLLVHDEPAGSVRKTQHHEKRRHTSSAASPRGAGGRRWSSAARFYRAPKQEAVATTPRPAAPGPRSVFVRPHSHSLGPKRRQGHGGRVPRSRV